MGRCFFQLLLLLLLVHKTSAYYYDYALDGNEALPDVDDGPLDGVDTNTLNELEESEVRDEEICKNTNGDERDSHGDDCSFYTYNPWDCGNEEYKTENFDMEEMCCACGGGSQQNAIYGQMMFDTTKCSNFELNRAVLHEVLAPYFQYTAGIDVLEMDDPNMPPGTIGFEIDISTDGLHINPSIQNFESIKKIIRDSIDCNDKSGIDLHHFDTMAYESMVEGFEPDEMDSNPGSVEDQDDLAEDNAESSSRSTRTKAEIIIPHEKSYRNLIGEIRDQESIGSCVAFSADGMFQFYEKRDNDILQEFSPKYFYYHRHPSQIARGRSGMSIVKVGDITHKAGAVPETVYPYTDVKNTEGVEAIPENIQTMGVEYGQDHYANHLYFCTDSYIHKSGVEDFKLAIQSYLAIFGVAIISVPTYDFGCEFWNANGGKRISRHSMVVDGYDENGLHIRNSWGPNWCENGYTSMSWKDAFTRSFGVCFWKKPIDSAMEKLDYRKIKVETNCLVEKDVAYDGDFKNVPNVNSAEKCAHVCYQSPRCITWTYESQTCFMKDKYRYNKEDKEGSISGLPCSKEGCDISGDVPTGKQCSCSGTICTANHFCYDEKCNDIAKCPISNDVPTGKQCSCSGTTCNSNQFCYDGKCNDFVKCPISFSVRTGKQCSCSGTTCNSNQWCYDEKCNNKEKVWVPCTATFITNTGARHHNVQANKVRDFWVFSIRNHPWYKMVAVNKQGNKIQHRYGRFDDWDRYTGSQAQWPYNVENVQFCEPKQKYRYLGCHRGGLRSYDMKPISVSGVEDCRRKCSRHHYFAFACPQAHVGKAACSCSNHVFNRASDQSCRQYDHGTPHATWCNGKQFIETNIGTYYMGAATYWGVYSVN